MADMPGESKAQHVPFKAHFVLKPETKGRIPLLVCMPNVLNLGIYHTSQKDGGNLGVMKAWISVALMAWAVSVPAHADDSVDLATELANPLAKLISIPVQGNYNSGYGPRENGEQVLTNLQPVMPFSINEDCNLISRTILPIVWQLDMFPGAGSQFGLGNTRKVSSFLLPRP